MNNNVLQQNKQNEQGEQDKQNIREIEDMADMLDEAAEQRLINYNHITYLLYLVSFFTAGIMWIVPIIMNYLKRNEAKGSWLYGHFSWQIKTFWYSIVGCVIGGFIMFFSAGSMGVGLLAESQNMAVGSIMLFGLGILLFVGSILWHLYRIVRGWIALTNREALT